MNICNLLQRLSQVFMLPIGETLLQKAGIQSGMPLPYHKLHFLVGLIADQNAAEMKAQLAKA